jgi:phosphopantetheinyl transferase
MACALPGLVKKVSAEALYSELVRCVADRRNALDPILLSPEGAMCWVRGPAVVSATIPSTSLGAGDHPPSHEASAGLRRPSDLANASQSLPSHLEGALHVANAWGQRSWGLVTAPADAGQRIVFAPWQPGEQLLCRLFPAPAGPERAAASRRGPDSAGVSGPRPRRLFDLWFFREDGTPIEACLGALLEAEPEAGRRPPAWFAARAAEAPLEGLQRACAGLVVLELSAVAPFADRALSDSEAARLPRMRPGRRRSYVAGRLAAKLLARRLAGDHGEVEARRIETISPDSLVPVLLFPSTVGAGEIDPSAAPAGPRALGFCSIAHDRRFAVAVAADGPIGVDVEEISDRPLRGARLFLSDAERALTTCGPEPPIEVACRLWTVKEAAGKALGLNLVQAWHEVQVQETAGDRSVFSACGRRMSALHAEVDGHLFTLVHG